MSLAQQLRNLQIPGQASIQQASTKKSSLLFDLKTAASLDNEAIQDIGYHGFKELTQIDPVFSRFESLFDRTSVQFQRNFAKEEVASKVQKKIRNFLILLSPYVLLKPAQKTLEWLIRRYQSHIWDKEALIASILPYHETNIFGRIIQLFGNQPNNDEWDWLLSCQKDGKGFSTQALVKHCVTNRTLMTFIFKMADDATEVLKFNPKSGLKTIFSFHARMFVAVMDATPVISEDVLSTLLPFIHAGLKSGVRDYVCSTYMGISGLASKIKFAKDVCKAVLAGVLKSMDIGWYEEGFLCLLAVIQLQRVKTLSQRIFKLFLNLQRHKSMEMLSAISKDYDISRFVELITPMLCGAVVSQTTELCEKATEVLNSFIDDLDLGEKHINLICKNLVQACVDKEDSTKNVPPGVRKLLVHLSKRYSKVFDECVATFFRDLSANDDSAKLDRLKQISTSCLSEKHHTNKDSDFPLVLSLNHPESSIRITAVEQLFASNLSGNSVGEDIPFLRDAVLTRLDDEDPAVVKTVLKYPKAIVKLLPADTLHDLVLKMMAKSGHFNLNELIVAVLKEIEAGGQASQKSTEFIYAVLAQVMFSFTGKRNKKLIDALGSAEFASSNVIMKGISASLAHIQSSSMLSDERTEETVVPLFTTVLDHITDAMAKSENTLEVVSNFWSYVQALPVGHDLQFLRLVLVLLLVEKCPLLCGNFMQLDFSQYLASMNKVAASDIECVTGQAEIGEQKKHLFSKYYAVLNTTTVEETEATQKQLLGQGFFVLMKAVIQTLRNNQANLSELKVAKESLFSILASCALNGNLQCYRDLLNNFLAGVFKDKGDILMFLCSLYMKLLLAGSEMTDEHFEAAVCSLHITRSLIADTEQESISQHDGIVYATHFSLLQCPLPLVRDVVLDNIAAMASNLDKQHPWSYIFQQAVENKNEISMDASHARKCWQASFDIKEASTFSAFNKSSKKEKLNAMKKSSLLGLTSTLKKYPIALQLSVIDCLSLVDAKHTMGEYIGVLQDALTKPSTSNYDAMLVQLVLNAVKAEMMDSFSELFPLYVKCIHHTHSTIQNTALKMIVPEFFNRLRSFELQKSLIVELLKLLQNSNSVNLSTSIRISLKDLNLSSEIINIFLQQFSEAFDQFVNVSIAPLSADVQLDVSDEDLKFPMWRTLMEILEAITCSTESGQREKLVPKLFRVLERCLKCTGVEYVKQLVLTSLVNITREDMSSLSEDQFQVELLVQCLQSSDNTQTSQLVLKVLSNAARVYPTLVLHNIMHIFSFMGGTMLRLDNAYSFEIMEKTINAVIPVLIKKDEPLDTSSRKRPAQASLDEIVTFILQTFVDSIPHCPEHRRLHIIQHLVSILREEDYLHLVMILLLKKVSRRNQKHTSEEQNMQLSPVSLEFCKDLFVTYPIPTQVHSLFQMIGYLNSAGDKDAPQAKKSASSDEDEVSTRRQWKEANLHKYVVLTFAEEILGGANIRSGYEVKVNEQQQLTYLYLQLIEELLFYSDTVSKSSEEMSAHDKSLQKKVSDVMSQLYGLLPFDSFISIMSELLCKDNELMRKKSLELLCKKLSNLDQHLTETQEHSLVELFKILMPLVKYKEGGDEIATNKQMMLYAIKLIAVKLINKQKEHFIKAVPIIAQLYTLEESNDMLAINAMLCVAELSSLLKTDMIPYLPIVMKPLLKKTAFDLSLKEQLLLSSTECQKGCLAITSSVTILHTLLKSLSSFCSPYVSDFILNVSTYDVVAQEVSDAALIKKVASLKTEIGKAFPPRVLYPAIEKCFSSFLTEEKQRTVSMVEIYRSSFKTISKSDANSNYSNDILNITKTIFDVYTIIGAEDSLCDTLEGLAIQAFDDLILKLTENTLRPMYLELLNWATESGGVSRRLLSFFRLSLQLSKSLKSLFLLFVGHILKNANDVLSNLNTLNGNIEGTVSIKIHQDLVIAVLDTLSNCFLHDSQGFINKERFETILKPLVDQMENKLHGEEYISFAKEHLTPCIVNFATVVNDASCWKQLNHQILTRTKSECEFVRLVSLFTIEKMSHHMGESYLVLIPETIPFLAEILEDDSFEVEKQCQSVIKVIEDISGESIQKYF